MVGLFTFDETQFSRGFETVDLEDRAPETIENVQQINGESFLESNLTTRLKEFNSSEINNSLQSLDDGDLEVKAFEADVEEYSGLSIPESKVRRRSSVYRRLSIRPSSVTSNHLFMIPSNFNKDYEDDRATNQLGEKDYKRTLQDFEPIKVLGQGAYGKVHLVEDKHTRKLYAQKQLRKPVINIQEDSRTDNFHIKRTIYERNILSNINHHPNIVKLFYALQDHDKFYLFLEYIPGGELFHHLTTNNSLGNVFKEDDVAFYAAQMALGLRHLHKLGIVYRDLKPENCLLDVRGNLVLTDFGLSKDIGNENEDKCNSIIGTPEYMAPEILKGEEYDYGVDWWSLGCVIYDMMSGKPPFTGNSHKVIQDKILKNKLSLPFYFSLDAKDLLNKLLNKNPQKRFQIDDNWEVFKKHRFFRKLNWKLLEVQDDSIIPPIVPIITDPKLAENFSSDFTSLKVSDYNIDQAINIPISSEAHPYQNFQGFSYTASTSFIDKFS